VPVLSYLPVWFCSINRQAKGTQMRRIIPEPELFRSRQLRHKQARELVAIDRILLANPSAAEAVWKDLQGTLAKTGRPGLSADQVLRAAIIKQMTGYSYSDLCFHLADSETYRRFCGFACPEEAPRKSALAHSIKRITAETWEEINRILLGYAKREGIEGGERVRIDPTVTETNIHAPTDNKLLFDCVRVLGRLLKRARKSYGVEYSSRIKRAKRRHIEVMNAPNQKRRLAPYKDLLKVTKETIRYANQAVKHLREENGSEAYRLAEALEYFIELAWSVVSQTERRVLGGESVPAQEKIVSIFEPHTDIIRKDRRNTYYGHKVELPRFSGQFTAWCFSCFHSTLFRMPRVGRPGRRPSSLPRSTRPKAKGGLPRARGTIPGVGGRRGAGWISPLGLSGCIPLWRTPSASGSRPTSTCR
jgi:transposase, IS5 family